MLALLTSLVLAQAPAAKPDPNKPIQVLLLDLSAIDVSPDKVKLLTAKLASAMGARGLEVVTKADIQTMANLEADKLAAGCDEAAASCMAEIASALGTRLVLSGQVGALDDTIFLQISLFDSQVGKAVSREEARGKSLSAIADAIPGLIDRALVPVLGAPAPTTAVAAASSGGISPLVIGGGAAAGVGALAALGLGGWALALDGTLGSTTASKQDKQFAVDNGVFIVAGAGVGGAVAVAGVGLLAVGLMAE